jgi:hypothetical protein
MPHMGGWDISYDRNLGLGGRIFLQEWRRELSKVARLNFPLSEELEDATIETTHLFGVGDGENIVSRSSTLRVADTL